MAFHIKNKVRRLTYFLLYRSGLLAHKTLIDWDRVRLIKCTDDEIKPLHECSNNLFYIMTSQAVGYFRPILPHKSLDRYVKDAILSYFTVLHPEQTLEWNQVKETVSKRKSFRKLIHMGDYSDPYSKARQFYLTKDTTFVGIITPNDLSRGSEEWKWFIINIDHFLKYVMNTMRHHRRNIRGGKWEFSNANRQMATEAIASMIGIGHMFPHSEFVVIESDTTVLRGTLMSPALGESTESISDARSHALCSPSLQRELTNLNLLDTITYERDHRPGNYNIILDEKGKGIGLSVFDNDAEMTFAPFPISTHSGSGSSKLIINGLISRPHLDVRIANNILNLNKDKVRDCIMMYLNRMQILMCWYRILTLKKAIKKSSKQIGFLIEANQWSAETIDNELSGQYGRTYLDTFVNYEKYNRRFQDYNNVAPL